MGWILGSLGKFEIAAGGLRDIIFYLNIYELKVSFVEKVILLIELVGIHGLVHFVVYWGFPSWLLSTTD